MSEVATMETVSESVPAVKKSPAIHLLPLSLGRLAEHTDDSRIGGRFALAGVQVSFDGNNFVAESTDTKMLARIEGPCGDADDYPTDCVPGLGSSPNGATRSIIPAKTWAKVFKQANGMKFRRAAAKLATVACVVGDNVTTFGATDTESRMCEQTMNMEGRFPPTVDIIKQCQKLATMTFAVDPAMLIELLKTAQKIGAERVTFQVTDGSKPILLHSTDGTIKFTGIIMPLAPDETQPASE